MFSQPVYINPSLNNIKELGQSFNAAVLGNSFLIDNERMQGSSKRIELEKGLCLQTWDLHLREESEFTKFVSEFFHEPFYYIHYFFSPSEGEITIDKDVFNLNTLDKVHALVSGDMPVTLRFKTACYAKCLTVFFTRSWMINQFNGSGQSASIPEWLQQPTPVFFPNYTSSIEQMLSSELFILVNENRFPFQIKANLFQLLDNKLRQISGEIPTLRRTLMQDEIVIQIERKIMEALTSSMPSIEELARSFYISPSTLKRHFKSFFGENIYSYYLRKKMVLAKNILADTTLRVSEVANSLGYDSVSHFVHMFKKIHKVSPGQIRKSTGNNEQTKVVQD